MRTTTRRLPATLTRVVFLLASMAAMVAVLFTISKQLRAAGQFGQGNLVIYRVGTGTGTLVNTGNAVFLDEYTPSGTLVQSVAMPTTSSGLNKPLISSGTATSEGFLTRSADGAYLLVPGYGTTTGGVSVAGTAAATVPRVVGRVDALGSIDTTTALTDWADANNPRGAVSSDGSRLWVTGAGGGVRTATLGSTTSLQLSTTTTNLRVVNIFGGQLYVSSSSGAIRLAAVGSGLPTTSGQTITNLPGFPTSGSQYAFVFADLDAGVPGVDTVYVADDTNTVGVGGITKYALVAGSWLNKGTVGAAADAYRGLTGVVTSGTVTLFATRKGGSGATGGGELVSVVDATGYNAAFSGTPTLLATATANTAFRGVALAPIAPVGTTPSVSLSVSTNSASETAQTAVTVTANASAAVVGDQTVNVSVTGTGITAGDYTLSNTTITIPNGTASGSVTFTVVDDPVFEGPETATLTIGTPSAGITIGSPASQAITITDNDPAPAACTAPHIAINAVQGTGETSPLNLTSVTVKGVVVGDFEAGLGGFYLQDLPADYDADPLTSEGIFVFETGTNDRVSVGQVVQVTGLVSEFQGQTEITVANAASFESCGTTASVTPTPVTLPVPTATYLERFEGMLVQFQQTLSVTEHFQLERFGQIVMSSGGRLPQPTSIVLPGAQAQSQQAANDLNRIIVDDDNNNQDPDPIVFGRGGNVLTALNTLRGGDTATNMVGVMTYGWAGNAASPNAYRLRPVQALGGGAPNFQIGNPRPSGPPSVGGSLKVVGMNVLNYFLTLDTGGTPCGPGLNLGCRGANSATERTRQQTKLNAALVKLNADVFGMMELENTTGVEPVADIVNRLNGAVGAGTYSFIDTGVIGGDAIRVGIVYKVASVTPVTPPAPALANVVRIKSALVDLDPVHNRPPVAQIFTDNGTGQRFTVIANHFKSKSCGDATITNPLDNDQLDGQGCWNATRVAQAQRLIAFIQGAVIPGAGDPDVMLIGDFNAYAKEDPIRTIEQAGFSNLAFRYGGPGAYSYLFDGQWGYLDHALASTSLLPQITGAGDYHINSDEPTALDYNTDFKSAGQIASLFNGDEFRISDHDPVMIGLALKALPVANPDHYSVEAGTPLAVGGSGVLGNDTGGPLALFSQTSTSHGTLALNANGTFTYTPATGFTGTDTFSYTISSATPGYAVQLFNTTLPPLATIGGVKITGGSYGSSLARVPGSTDEFYGLTDRGPNVDGPGGTKVEPIPSFAPAIGKFKLTGDQAVLEQSITLKAADGTPYNGRVSTAASTGETITDLNGVVLAPDANGYDPEGLVALPDGTFWVSDEYGPFITQFDATGKQLKRLSPFDGTLPLELAKRLPNRGMEGLTLTPDGTTLVGLMQSALQQDDLAGFDDKKLTPLRIVTYRLADGVVHEYLYLLDNPNVTKTAASEITALTNTQFLVDERDGNFPPGAYKKLFLIDITGATDVGPLASVPGAVYNAASGGLLVGGKTIELLLKTPSLTNAESAAALATAGITPAAKSLFLDLGGLLTSIDASGKFFGHDKIEGVAALNGGATLVIANDSDFGIDGLTNSTPPFQLHTKLTTAGVQDDGEFLIVDLVRSDATVTIDVTDTIPPDTQIDSTPSSPSNATSASFTFHGTDSGSGIASFECSLDSAAFVACISPTSYVGVGNGSHTFAVRAIDKAGNTDQTPATFTWLVDNVAPDTLIDSGPLNPTKVTSASFTFHGTDSGSGLAGFQCSLDSALFAACASGVSYPGLGDGAHTFAVRAVDAAGNVDVTPASYAWVIDTTAPDTVIDTKPTNPSTSTSATFTFHAVEGVGTAGLPTGITFQCSLDSAPFTTCLSGVTYSGLASGPHTFAVRALDGLGNTDATPASYPWTIQAPAPLLCDVNNDNVVNTADLTLIAKKNNQAASGPNDPFDPNHDGVISVADVRFCTLRVTTP